MKIQMFQVDSFTSQLFSGNSAAVCMLEEWLDDEAMLRIADENNLSETAFIVRNGADYDIRWFTPLIEVALCGHATLAAAHIIFNHYEPLRDQVSFNSVKNGVLKVKRDGQLLTLDFPSDQIEKVNTPHALAKGLGMQPQETYRGKTDYLAVFSTEDEVRNLTPHFNLLGALQCRGIIVTAKGENSDFVSRFFAPQCGINEDPVTGSAHTTLAAYWSKVLGKTDLTAIQLSKRMGHLKCKYLGDRTEISGHAVTFMAGEIEVLVKEPHYSHV